MGTNFFEEYERSKSYVWADCKGVGCMRTGGFVLLWNDELEVDIMTCSVNHIDALVSIPNIDDVFHMSSMYGHLEETNKLLSMELLKALRRKNDKLSWLCLAISTLS